MFRSELWGCMSPARCLSLSPSSSPSLSLGFPLSHYSSRASDRWSRPVIYVSWTVAVFFSYTTPLRCSSPSITLDRISVPFHLWEPAIGCRIRPRAENTTILICLQYRESITFLRAVRLIRFILLCQYEIYPRCSLFLVLSPSLLDSYEKYLRMTWYYIGSICIQNV